MERTYPKDAFESGHEVSFSIKYCLSLSSIQTFYSPLNLPPIYQSIYPSIDQALLYAKCKNVYTCKYTLLLTPTPTNACSKLRKYL